MAQGIVIRTKDGNTQTVTPDQLQQIDPWLYSKYVQNIAQPQAGLQQTQAATGAEGASAAASSASAERTQAELPAAQQAGEQAQAWNTIQKYFDGQKDSKTGKVSPDLYNAAKSQAAGIGIDGDAFDKTFADNYTDPTNINYNTADDQASRQQFIQTKKGLESTLDQFAAIPADQKGLFSKAGIAQVPLLGKLLAPQAQEYENSVKALAAQIAPEAGGGTGSGIRVTQTELSQWANLLPSPTKTNEQNTIDLKQLDDRLQAKFGKGNGLDSNYLPDSKGNIPNQASGPSFGTEALNFLTGDLQKGAKMIGNYPAALKQGAQEIQQKGALGAPSADLLGKLTGGNLQETGNRFGNAAEAGYQSSAGAHGAAGEIGNIVTAPAVAKDIVTTGGNLLEKILGNGAKDATPVLDKSILDIGKNLATEGNTVRDTAIKTAETAGKTIDGNTLLQGIKDWGVKAIQTGQDEKVINQQVESATKQLEGKVFTPSEAKSLWDAANQGYKDSGKAGQTILASFQRTLRDSLRGELDTVTSNEFSAGTSKIAEGLTKDKVLSQVKTSLEKAGLKAGLTPTPAQQTVLQKILKTGMKLGLDATGAKGIYDIFNGR